LYVRTGDRGGTVTIDYRPEGVVCEIEGRVAYVPV
jgi:hypothetical protein